MMKTNFKEGLSIVERVDGESSSLPILKNILMETVNNKIQLTTTNLEAGVSSLVSGKIIEEGKITVPRAAFSAIINNLPSERLNLEQKGNNLIIKTDNYEATIQGLPAEEFPLIPHIKNQNESLKINSGVLREAIGQVLAASQFSEIRPELNAMLFDFSLDALRIVATDSFRLAEKTISKGKFETNIEAPFRILVPIRTAQGVLRILGGEGDTTICRDEHQVLFQSEQWKFVSRLIDATFPDYAAVVPKKFSSEVVLGRSEFLDALKLAGVFGSKAGEVHCRVLQGKKSIELYSTEQGLGENRHVLSAKIEGGAGEVTFNWRYLSDGLKVLKSEEVYLGLNEDNKPALLKSPGEGSYFYILMPVLRA